LFVAKTFQRSRVTFTADGIDYRAIERGGRGVLATEITRGWEIAAAGRQTLSEA